ncbi:MULTISPECIES: hypothetical protein [Calothrix]|uniref:Uncharacterized protein n=2 Tax=Calothrix TaxID=1186 RepID=A0ABR8A9F1_9CYAN|nr:MULTISPECIES: hypothetical protein [Calothrix]MBD2196610.1 hypothetical protein [Calothrix parietina FACHB-288]MBD2228025.1 hypothetical protein [Calothrix anomala FACHB-343]
MTLYQKLAEVEGKMAEVEVKLGNPQRKHLLVRHQIFNQSTRVLDITDTLILPKPYITFVSPKLAAIPIAIEGAEKMISLYITDIQVEIPRTFPRSLFEPPNNIRPLFILEPPVSNNQVVYTNPTTKEISGAGFYKMMMLMDNDPTLWKFILRKEKK